MMMNYFSNDFKTLSIRICAGVLMLIVAACDSPEEKAKAHYEAGVEFVEVDNFVKAGIEFRNALQLNENYADAWYGLALVEEHEGNWQKYAGDVLKAIELDPNHLKAQIRFGKILLLSGDIEKALETSDLVLRLAPENADALALRAAVLFKLGDLAGAVKTAKASLAVDQANTDATSVLAAERLQADDPAQAVIILDEGLSHNKGNVPLQLVKLQSLDKLGRTEDIITVFKELIADNPEDNEYKKSLSRFYVRNDRNAEAEEVLRSISSENPDDLTAKLDVVRFVKSTKGDEEARLELEKLIVDHPEEYEYQFALSELLLLQGKDEEGQAILQSIAEKAVVAEEAITAKNKVAQIQLSKGNLNEARILIDDVLAVDGQNANALVLRGAMQVDDGKIEGAISNLRSALKQNPESVRASLLLARAHEINGAVELAEDRFAAAYRFGQRSPAIGLAYADFLSRHGQLDRAEVLLEDLAKRYPRDVGVLQMLAQLQLRKQDWGSAEELAEKIKELDGGNPVAYEISGRALAGLQNTEESESAFEQAYKATPDAGSSMQSLVAAYIRNGKIEKAEKFLRSILEGDSENYPAKLMLAQVELVKGDSKQAEVLLKELIADFPDQQAGYLSLARLYLTIEQKDEAQQVLTSGLLAIPNNFVLSLMQAGVYESENKINEAIGIYENLLKIRPNSDIVVNNIASLIAENATDKESLQRAYSYAKRFRNTKVPYFKDTLGWIHYRLGEYDLAEPLLFEAVEELPNVAILKYHLGMTYKANSKPDAAIKELEEALKLGEEQNFIQAEEAKRAIEEIKSGNRN